MKQVVTDSSLCSVWYSRRQSRWIEYDHSCRCIAVPLLSMPGRQHEVLQHTPLVHLLNEKRKRFHLALSSIFTADSPLLPRSPSQNDLLPKHLRIYCSCNFKIYQRVALERLYISIRNDVTSYFRSAADRINMFTLGHVWVAISR